MQEEVHSILHERALVQKQMPGRMPRFLGSNPVIQKTNTSGGLSSFDELVRFLDLISFWRVRCRWLSREGKNWLP
jgi:hypothetical protein